MRLSQDDHCLFDSISSEPLWLHENNTSETRLLNLHVCSHCLPSLGIFHSIDKNGTNLEYAFSWLPIYIIAGQFCCASDISVQLDAITFNLEFVPKLFMAHVYLWLAARASVLTGRLPIRNGFYSTNQFAKNCEFSFTHMLCNFAVSFSVQSK